MSVSDNLGLFCIFQKLLREFSDFIPEYIDFFLCEGYIDIRIGLFLETTINIREGLVYLNRTPIKEEYIIPRIHEFILEGII